MHKNIIIAFLITILFLGAAVQPSTAIVQQIKDVEDDEYCSCNDKSERQICNILFTLMILLELRGSFLILLYEIFSENEVLYNIFNIYEGTIHTRWGLYFVLGILFNCGWILGKNSSDWSEQYNKIII